MANGYHAEHIYSNKFIKQKIDYIHNNPVKDKTVSSAEDYYFSSARNYSGLENDLEVVLLYLFWNLLTFEFTQLCGHRLQICANER